MRAVPQGAIKVARSPDAGQRPLAEIFNYVLEAIRAHDAKTICVEKPPQNSPNGNQ